MSEVEFYLCDAEHEYKVDSDQWRDFVIAMMLAILKGTPPFC